MGIVIANLERGVAAGQCILVLSPFSLHPLHARLVSFMLGSRKGLVLSLRTQALPKLNKETCNLDFYRVIHS